MCADTPPLPILDPSQCDFDKIPFTCRLNDTILVIIVAVKNKTTFTNTKSPRYRIDIEDSIARMVHKPPYATRRASLGFPKSKKLLCSSTQNISFTSSRKNVPRALGINFDFCAQPINSLFNDAFLFARPPYIFKQIIDGANLIDMIE